MTFGVGVTTAVATEDELPGGTGVPETDSTPHPKMSAVNAATTSVVMASRPRKKCLVVVPRVIMLVALIMVMPAVIVSGIPGIPGIPGIHRGV